MNNFFLKEDYSLQRGQEVAKEDQKKKKASHYVQKDKDSKVDSVITFELLHYSQSSL